MSHRPSYQSRKLSAANMLVCLFALGYILTDQVHACTTVGFAGDALRDGGTLIAKNRDAPIKAYQRLTIFHPKGKNRYIGLAYSDDKKAQLYPYLAAGTNEHGLTVLVNDPASHYPKGRNENQIETVTLRTILENYTSVQQVREHAKELFGQNNPALYILSDKGEVANFEAGYKHAYGERVTDNGHVWALNLYHLTMTKDDNVAITEDIKTRYKTLSRWLPEHTRDVVPGDVSRLLASAYHGPFNSIEREVTVAQYMVHIPGKQSPQLRVKLTNPTQPYNIFQISLTPEFFSITPAGPLDERTYGLLGTINMKAFDQFIESVEHAE